MSINPHVSPNAPLGHTLVIRPGALGDAVLTLPALHALRLAGAESLTVLGTPVNWGFVRVSHQGLRVRDFASSQWLGLFCEEHPLGDAARAALAQTRTAIVCLPDSSIVERVLRRAGVKTVLTLDPPIATPTDNSSSLHAARKLLDPLAAFVAPEHALAALEILTHDADPFITIDEHERLHALQRIGCDALPEGGFFALHPGSGGRKKCWPAERYAALAVKLSCLRGLTPLVFFGPADDAVKTRFENSMPPGVCWEAASNLSLREVLALLIHCRGYVGNDSGVTHLAARACPATAIFGPSDSRIWSPLGRQIAIVHAPDENLDKLSVKAVFASLLIDGETLQK